MQFTTGLVVVRRMRDESCEQVNTNLKELQSSPPAGSGSNMTCPAYTWHFSDDKQRGTPKQRIRYAIISSCRLICGESKPGDSSRVVVGSTLVTRSFSERQLSSFRLRN
jgi:hypothetical protein